MHIPLLKTKLYLQNNEYLHTTTWKGEEIGFQAYFVHTYYCVFVTCVNTHTSSETQHNANGTWKNNYFLALSV